MVVRIHIDPPRGSACGTLTLVHSGGRGAVFDAVRPSFVNRPCRTTITVWIHGPADSSRFWPTEHCTSYLPTSSCGGWVINRRCWRRRR
jgi:hypothetical protein